MKIKIQHDDVIKWKHFPRYWPFVLGIHRSPVNPSHKGQWRGALMFFLIYVWTNDWINNREAGDLRRYRAHSDVIVMKVFIHENAFENVVCEMAVILSSGRRVKGMAAIGKKLLSISCVSSVWWTKCCYQRSTWSQDRRLDNESNVTSQIVITN